MKSSNSEVLANADLGNVPKYTEVSKQSPRPRSHDPNNLKVSKELSFTFRKRGITEMLSAVKYLFSLAYYEESLLSHKQSFVLQGLLDSLLSVNDHAWNEKYRKQLLTVADFYSLVTERDVSSGRQTIEPYKIAINWKCKSWLMSPHAYYGRKVHFRLNRWFISINRQLNKAPPPERYIGVGYKDHGTCSNPAYDGSPSWSEVATSPQMRTDHSDSLCEAHLLPPERYSLYLRQVV